MHARWRLSHARGYLALGLTEEAGAELDALDEKDAASLEARGLRALVLQAHSEWLLLEPLAADLVRQQPEEAGWWIMWAYAARRADSLHVADAILRDAETRHPKEATIQFNLGCYACQRGDLAEAKCRVAKAISLDRSFLEAARKDPDLEALRASGFPGRDFV